MIFKPKHITSMWDTWMVFHAGTYYLYYLITEHSPGEGIGLATSNDGVHWQEHGWILHMAADALWLGTGSVWKSSAFEADGKFIMNFSEWRGPEMGVGQQTIFFAESSDLIHWKRLGPDYEFSPDPQVYRINEGDNSRWDCIYPIPRPGGGYYGYWTANPKNFHPGFGFGETVDGYHWRSLPAPKISWGDVQPFEVMEAGATEKFGDRYYAMLGTYRRYGKHSRGMFTFTTSSPAGPFRPAQKNFAVLTSPKDLNATYFARFFPAPDGILVNHQSVTRTDQRWFGTLKRAVVDPEGVLRLAYWEGNDCLSGEELPFPDPRPEHTAQPVQSYNLERGVIFEGTVRNIQPVPLSPDEYAFGIFIENEGGTGTLVRIHSNTLASFGFSDPDGKNFHEENRVDREMGLKDCFTLRLLARNSLLELYVDDYLMQCFSFHENATGRVTTLIGNEVATFSQGKVFAMTLES